MFKQRKIEEEMQEQPDVYLYDTIPTNVRIQIWHIITGVLGEDSPMDRVYEKIEKYFLRELGVFSLNDMIGGQRTRYDNPRNDLGNFMLKVDDTYLFISVVEVCFRLIRQLNYDNTPSLWFNEHQTPTDAIEELNIRFQRANLGYEFVDGLVVRINSKEIHKEIVKPSLSLLSSEKIYKGADAEYRAAFNFYKEGKYEQVLGECNKALESCLIAICKKREWKFPSKPTTGNLIPVCKENNLFPPYSSDYLGILSGLLKGVSVIRGQSAAHGQGTEVRQITKEVASYALHLTATNIVFLIDCEKVLND